MNIEETKNLAIKQISYDRASLFKAERMLVALKSELNVEMQQKIQLKAPMSMHLLTKMKLIFKMKPIKTTMRTLQKIHYIIVKIEMVKNILHVLKRCTIFI